MDENGNANSSEPGTQDPAPSSDDESSKEEASEDRATRMNAAKAFYRAMYAGEDVVPDDFGMKAPGGGGGDDSHRSGPCPNCARLESQASENLAKAQEMENLYKRMAADFENYRRRLDREREEFAGTGVQKAIEAILPAMDDLDRAKQTLHSSVDPKAILDSLNLVYTRFTKCLEGLGIKPLEVVGTPFDPRMHEPVQEIETKQFADGAVMHELRKGYSFKDKILRPTLVNVASNSSGVIEAPPAEEAKPAADETPAAEPEETAEAAVEPAKSESAKEAPADKKEKSEKSEKAESHGKESKSKDKDHVLKESSKSSEEKKKSSEAEKTAAATETNVSEEDALDALNESLKFLVGSEEEKGAKSGAEGYDPTATADLPVIDINETLHEIDDSGKEKKKEPKVYDISDADTEE
ncbi:MAG TPA: nucleotide exchange factor GrpE [Trichormus sp.]|jgi:molecular chaperone GrpE